MTALGTNLSLRALEAADAAAFQKIRLFGLQESPSAFGSSYEEMKEASLEEYAKRLGGDRQKEMVIGAFAGEALIGVGGLARCDRLKEKHKAWIWGIYVRPEFRGCGAARKIMQELMEAAQLMKGLVLVNLTVTASNSSAKKLYESFGFKTYGHEPKAICVDGQFFDWIHMSIELGGE